MTAATDHIPAKDITILLVEDDPPTCLRLKDALAAASFDVTAAMTLPAAAGQATAFSLTENFQIGISCRGSLTLGSRSSCAIRMIRMAEPNISFYWSGMKIRSRGSGIFVLHVM